MLKDLEVEWTLILYLQHLIEQIGGWPSHSVRRPGPIQRATFAAIVGQWCPYRNLYSPVVLNAGHLHTVLDYEFVVYSAKRIA